MQALSENTCESVVSWLDCSWPPRQLLYHFLKSGETRWKISWDKIKEAGKSLPDYSHEQNRLEFEKVNLMHFNSNRFELVVKWMVKNKGKTSSHSPCILRLNFIPSFPAPPPPTHCPETQKELGNRDAYLQHLALHTLPLLELESSMAHTRWLLQHLLQNGSVVYHTSEQNFALSYTCSHKDTLRDQVQL